MLQAHAARGPVTVHPSLVGRAIELKSLREQLRTDAYRSLFHNNGLLVDLFIGRLLGGAPLTPE
jgi:hypothetical protein